VPLTFPNIRGRLAKETGNEQVTVPTMVTEDGFVTDSWEIAQWVSDCGGVLASPGAPRSWAGQSCGLGGRMP
jgi:glutathione S-transferase